MRRSIATVSMSGTLSEKLDAIASAKFDGVEIFENDLLFYSGAPRDVRRHAANLGLTIDLFQPFRDCEGVSDAQFARTLERAERKFDLMGELGAPLMLVCSNVSPEAIDDDARAAAQLAELAERAARRGLKIGYEALAWGTHVNTFDRAWKIVEQGAHPHLGLIVDSFHTLALPNDWSGLSKIPGDRIFFVQLADAPRLGVNTLTLSRHFRNLPGQGDLDVPAFLEAVLAAGYAGPISLEIFNDDLRAAPTRQTVEDGMRSLLFLEERIRRRAEAAQARGEARPIRRHVELFDPPPAPHFSGVSFVEFTVDQASEPALAAFLRQIGFRKVGQHRSKDVELYGQGDVRFVLNREPESFAHSYLLVHGPSVCALALETDDPHAAMARAESYGCMRYQGRLGPRELAIPAVRALDGSLVYFTETGQVWADADFELVEAPGSGESALLRVDHVAQSLPEGQLDAWILFYRAAMGLTPGESHVIADPYGLMRSKAVANEDRSLRLPLNISESRNTATSRSVSAFAGAGVSHIALTTRDIVAAADAAAAAGAPILPIPANYYDDIAARFDIDPHLLAAIRARNILYDRVGDGEFLHFYTAPFEDRFFFEVVERRGGYDLYGAANAPVRLAALAHWRAASESGAAMRAML